MTDEEYSEGGSRIYRYEAEEGGDDAHLSEGDSALIEAIHDHLERCFPDGESWVWHELVSPTIHVDVHVIPPTDSYPFVRLVTSGMAEAPMTVPEGFRETRYAELTIALPPDWPLDVGDFEDENVYWPVRLLRSLARLPHEHSTFLWHGHTIPNGDPPDAYAAGTGLCCALIIPPLAAPDDFERLDLADGRSIRFLGVLPIYRDEMGLKLQEGTDALFDLLDEHGVADVIGVQRASVAPRKRGFFGR